jgi:hypothetical protein
MASARSRRATRRSPPLRSRPHFAALGQTVAASDNFDDPRGFSDIGEHRPD